MSDTRRLQIFNALVTLANTSRPAGVPAAEPYRAAASEPQDCPCTAAIIAKDQIAALDQGDGPADIHTCLFAFITDAVDTNTRKAYEQLEDISAWYSSVLPSVPDEHALGGLAIEVREAHYEAQPATEEHFSVRSYHVFEVHFITDKRDASTVS